MDYPKDLSVKGSVIIDYFKIIRANRGLPWEDHLTAGDLDQLEQMILPSSWYPAELFDRMGVAIFKLVSRESYEVVHNFGRMVGDKMNRENPGMVVPGRAHDTLNKFFLIEQRFFSYKFFEIGDTGPGHILLHFYAAPGIQGTRLLIESFSGTMERLIELSGSKDVKTEIIEPTEDRADKSSLEVRWKE